MAFEVWLFSDQEQFECSGKLVAVELPPREYTKGDVHNWASMMEDRYRASIPDVTSVVREEAAY